MFAPVLQQRRNDWPADMARGLRTMTLTCDVSGSATNVYDHGPPERTQTVTYSGSYSETFDREGWHFGSPASGHFVMGEEVDGRNFRLLFNSASEDTYNVSVDEGPGSGSNDFPFGTILSIIAEGDASHFGPFMVAFVGAGGSGENTGQTPADIIAGQTYHATFTPPGFTGTITVDFELAFS